MKRTAIFAARAPAPGPGDGRSPAAGPTGVRSGQLGHPSRSLPMTRQWLAGLGLLAAGLVAGWSAARSQAPPGDKPDPAPAAGKAADRSRPLDTLDWMVGDWVDDDPKVTAEFSCHFTKNDAFLLRSFRIALADDVRLSGMQLIAWDPARDAVRSWTFDS